MKRRSRPVRLGVAGLPTEMRNLRLGRAYALVAPDPAIQTELIAGTLVEALQAKQPAVVISAAPPGPLMSMIARHDIDAVRACRKRQLLFFRAGDDSLMRLRRAGTPQLLDEFDHFGFQPGGIIVMAVGEALIRTDSDGDASRHLTLLHQWLQATASTLLLLFEHPPETLLTSAGFDGVAVLSSAADSLRWTTQYWRLPESRIISPEYRLRRLPAGGLALDTRAPVGDTQFDSKLAAAADEERVIATASVVRGEQRIPALWEIVDDTEALLARASEAMAATCVLETSSTHRFRDLARSIHTLRRQRGPALKIVVYELGLQLRQSQEQLLLALGANVVVLDQGLDRLRSIIAGLRGQRYTREVIADFGEAFTRGLPRAQGGYLAPPGFCTALIDGARRAKALGLESVLLKLALRRDVDPITALSALRVRRPGDLFTFADGSLFLFLFGCWDHDADQILDRLFKVPISELIDAQVRFPTNSAAMAEAAQLHQRQEQHPAEDFSSRLELSLRPDPAGEAMTVVPGTAATPLAPVRRPVRRMAVAAPLTLKAGR